MARFTADQADNYGGNGGTGYFSLKNDKDVASVRFLYNQATDMEGVACHEVEVDGKKRYVNCLREYNQPIADCPFCAAKKFQVAKLFIPIYNIDDDRVQIWERGKKFFTKMSSIFSRYTNKDTDLVNHVFEIERNGKAGDTQTTYEIYEIEKDNTALEDLPELPEVIGGVVLDKSFDDMEYYLKYEKFPEESEEQPRRRSSRDDEEQPRRRGEDSGRQDREERVTRRTPARRGNDDEEF